MKWHRIYNFIKKILKYLNINYKKIKKLMYTKDLLRIYIKDKGLKAFVIRHIKKLKGHITII